MLHKQAVLESTLDLLKKIQALPNMSDMRLVGGTEMLISVTWEGVKRKIESHVREFVRTLAV